MKSNISRIHNNRLEVNDLIEIVKMSSENLDTLSFIVHKE